MAIAGARRLAHPQSLAVNLGLGAVLLSLVGDDAALDEWADRLVEVTTEQGNPSWRALGIIHRGWAKVKNGDLTEGIFLLRSGSIAYRATGAEVFMPHYLAFLARACELAGQIEEAVTLLDDGLQIAGRTGERWLGAELNRHKGELILRQGHAEEAEEPYRNALGIAEEQEARPWELRAAVSLARLHGDRGRRAEARDLLAPVYGWFTEGFDTEDLEQAKRYSTNSGAADGNSGVAAGPGSRNIRGRVPRQRHRLGGAAEAHDGDLKDLGMVLGGHRRKLLEAIAALRSWSCPQSPAADQVAPTVERRQLTVMLRSGGLDCARRAPRSRGSARGHRCLSFGRRRGGRRVRRPCRQILCPCKKAVGAARLPCRIPSRFYGQSRYHLYRGELDLALRLDEDLLRQSRQRNDTGGLVLAHKACGSGYMLRGKWR